ncbi:sensor histidine kinase [Planctomicrobium sp. SH668]|uniref:sensor histidine kinase n=1 Tax=Planctomicrobium sp. SH668 TaxID=3448126 RepID=UPI003F5BFE2D
MRSLFREAGKRLHTASRLNVLAIGTSLLLLSVASFGAWHVHRIQKQSEKLLSTKVISIQAAVELELQVQELRYWLDRILSVTTSPSNDRTTVAMAAKSTMLVKSQIVHWYREAAKVASTDLERELLSKIRSGLDRFYEIVDELDDSTVGADQLGRKAELAATILEKEIRIPAREIVSIDEQLLKTSLDDAAFQSRRLVQILLLVGIFGSLAALAGGYLLARTISKSLIQIQIPMLDVAGKLSEVSRTVMISTKLDLADLSPALERVSTEVNEVVEQLHVRHKEILHAEQLATAGQLAAGIAHEIRNPLMSMKLLVQHALAPDSGGLDEQDLSILDAEICRLEILLDDFLDFARPQKLNLAVVDIRSLAQGTLALVRKLADARNVNVECSLPDVPISLLVDQARIRQVLLNLMLNGIQVTPPNGFVRLSVKQARIDGRLVCQLQVSDDGPGLGDVTEERLFEPFFSTKEIGLGLGLPVSQRIVKLHGGELLLGPRTGGATFIVVLPMTKSKPQSDVKKLIENN